MKDSVSEMLLIYVISNALFSVNSVFQMNRPIQVKPAECDNRGGEFN
jgi:hypothetical protein